MGYSYSFDEDDSMELLIWSLVGVGVLILLVGSCCCCKRNTRGRVLQPPPDPNVSGALYPQQQYSVAVPTATLITHNVTTAYPVSAPAAYPHAGGPYPHAGGPYPHAGGPYPSAAPYPAAAPYPGAFPGAMPQPAPATATAPDVHATGLPPAGWLAAPAWQAAPGWQPHALPPTYDQVMGGEKSSPYNPNAPH